MGFFSKLFNGLTGEQNKNPLDSDGKPQEWFFSEEGKEAFLNAIKNFSAMQDVIDERGYHPVIGDACGGTLNTVRMKALNWPCRYFWNYLKTFPNVLYENCAVDTIQTMILYYLCAMATEEDTDGPAIPYPACLRREANPLLNFVLNYSEKYISWVNDTLVNYVYDGYCKNIDVSNEDWLYDKSIFFNAQGQMRPDEKIIQLMKARAKYPEWLDN